MPEPKLQSLGRQLLAAQGKGAAELGRQLQCTRGVVHAWLTGRKQPGAAARVRLEALGIPAASWSQASEGPATAQADPPPPRVRRGAARKRGGASPATQPARIDDGGLGEIEDLLAHVRAARRDPKLLAGERLRAAQEESKLLAHRARLEHQLATREEEIEDLCVRHPRWQALKHRIIAALLPQHRAAAMAVYEAVRQDFAESHGVEWSEPT
jgi:hypothetical protein